MRQRLTGIQFLAGHFIVNRRPVAIIQKPLDQIGRRSQIFQSLLVLDTDRGAAELGGDASRRYIHFTLLEYLGFSKVSFFVGAVVKLYFFVDQPVIDSARFVIRNS